MIIIPILLGLIDQLIKYLFQQNQSWAYLHGSSVQFFLAYYENHWAAFSLPIPSRPVAIFSGLIILWLFYKLLDVRPRLRFWVMFIIIGALSNLLDRVRLGFVVDYMGVGVSVVGTVITIARTAHFNLGDIMIVLGILGWCRAFTAKHEMDTRLDGMENG